MEAEEINNIDDDAVFWKEALKYVSIRFDSKEGQEKLKDFKEFQERYIKMREDYCKGFSAYRKELHDYLLGKLGGEGGIEEGHELFGSDMFSDMYSDKGIDLFLELGCKELLENFKKMKTKAEIKDYIESHSSFELDGKIEEKSLDIDTLSFRTRENGNAGAETYSEIDYNSALSIEKVIKNKYPIGSFEINTCDEWVILCVTIRK